MAHRAKEQCCDREANVGSIKTWWWFLCFYQCSVKSISERSVSEREFVLNNHIYTIYKLYLGVWLIFSREDQTEIRSRFLVIFSFLCRCIINMIIIFSRPTPAVTSQWTTWRKLTAKSSTSFSSELRSSAEIQDLL